MSNKFYILVFVRPLNNKLRFFAWVDIARVSESDLFGPVATPQPDTRPRTAFRRKANIGGAA